MNRRIIIKTAVICTGLFLIISSLGIFYLFHNYEFEKEAEVQVLVASTDINEGTVVNESMLVLKTIRESSVNIYMIQDLKNAEGKKAIKKISQGDYVRDYDLLARDNWHTDQDKVMVIPMDIESRLGNLIKKGSLVDIKILYKDIKSTPETVISRVKVEDILDENGESAGNSIGGKKAYGKFVLDNNQRDKIYIATQLGKLIFELYCDPTQKAAPETFQIPPEFLNS